VSIRVQLKKSASIRVPLKEIRVDPRSVKEASASIRVPLKKRIRVDPRRSASQTS
jgi:hypothetical protein